MESAHITKAHEHVRSAATATYGNSIATAGQEHESAASAFRDATKDTNNSEALRILNLLEDHHHKLATLIKEPPRKKEKKADAAAQALDASTSTPPPKPTTTPISSPSSSSPSSVRAQSRRRLPQSSIATNLAEKRGIPGVRRGTPSGTPVSVTNALASRGEPPATPVRDMLERQSKRAEEDKSRPSSRASLKEEKANHNATPPIEDNFKRFYSAFGGIISTISAPLAFTSLPLSPTPPTPATEPPPRKDSKPSSRSSSRNQSPEASRTVKSSEPDLAALISKPALRALQEGNTPHFANNESFYLVPTSGGTVSYANILQNPNAPGHVHHAAQNPNLDPISEGDNESGAALRGSSHEEFVDARETALPPSPTAARRPHSRGKSSSSVASARTLPAGRGAGQKTIEEYELQIETLLQTVDKQSKRIAMWETSSQSSHIALAQSFRARNNLPHSHSNSDPSVLTQTMIPLGSNTMPPVHPSSPPQGAIHSPTIPATQAPDPEMLKRIAALESQLSSQSAQINALASDKEALTKQNEKNALVLGRYREQWEKLKAGARKKQQERTERRVVEMRASSSTNIKDSYSGPANVEDDVEEKEAGKEGEEEEVVEEPGFGKA
ncbi:hypothetical protein P280DRAFT_455673 [Massarina eburnea CBS 473.64]|uniref:Uncharacterized protein n=1 Tax=Massarina eburnea CBS 473.64 TaxID=1395130 RepID=A0A6A6RT62_9PLEO|nr:hypothetical protein P280DRAFT_455673 [Massarina eburnea CBS 473.64]